MSLPVVAVVGITGLIGPSFVKAVLSPPFEAKFSYPIRVITSDATKAQEKVPELAQHPSKFQIVSSANAATGEGLVDAFSGTDIVINLAGLRFSHDEIVKAVAESKPKVYIPSDFGLPGPDFGGYAATFEKKQDLDRKARAIPDLKTVTIYTGLFTEYAYKAPGLGGLTGEASAIVYEPDAKWVTTSLADVGKAVAAVAAMSKDPSSLPDHVYLKGGELTRSEVVQLYTEITGKQVDITTKPGEEITTAADKVNKAGINSVMDFLTVLTAVLT